MRSQTSITPSGPSHWKLVDGPNGLCFSLEPRGNLGLAWMTAVVFVTFIVAFWFIPGIPLDSRLIMTAIGVAALAIVPSNFISIHRHEQRLGPYLVVDREAIHLRHARRILLRDFECFQVDRRWEVGDRVAYLIVKLKDGEEIEILGSIYPGEIARLKLTLDTKMGEAMIPPPQ